MSEFTRELTRWGIAHLVVWSDPFKAYLRGKARFRLQATHDRWDDYEWLDADPRSVVTATGTGSLTNTEPLHADVVLSGVSAGSEVIVRMNFHPAWDVSIGGAHIPSYARDGQLAFRVDADETAAAHLEYPRRGSVNVVAILALVIGVVIVRRM
jgi:hypothetical protein